MTLKDLEEDRMNKEMGDYDNDDDDIYEEEEQQEESDEEFDWSLNNSIFHHFLFLD